MEKNIDKRTPTPWKIDNRKSAVLEIWGDGHTRQQNGKFVCRVGRGRNGYEDAHLIVRAVNSHDVLKKAVTALHRDYWNGRPKEDHDMLCSICPAIAQAEGTTGLAEALEVEEKIKDLSRKAKSL